MKQVTAVGPVTERRRKPSGSFVRPMGVMPTDTSEGHAASGDPWDAYFGASLLVETPDGAVWVYPAPVGVGEGNYLDPNGSVICVITAHNQGGRAASDQENAAAQQRLEDELAQRGWTWWPTAGGDVSWTHAGASAAVVGAEESEVAALGADFGQDAIFVLDPRWRRVVSCVSGRVATTGWTIKPETGDAEWAPARLRGLRNCRSRCL